MYLNQLKESEDLSIIRAITFCFWYYLTGFHKIIFDPITSKMHF